MAVAKYGATLIMLNRSTHVFSFHDFTVFFCLTLRGNYGRRVQYFNTGPPLVTLSQHICDFPNSGHVNWKPQMHHIFSKQWQHVTADMSFKVPSLVAVPRRPFGPQVQQVQRCPDQWFARGHERAPRWWCVWDLGNAGNAGWNPMPIDADVFTCFHTFSQTWHFLNTYNTCLWHFDIFCDLCRAHSSNIPACCRYAVDMTLDNLQ